MAGLQSAAQQLQSYGRGSDTMLAHVSPDEAKFIDQIQGGRRTNPMTGLPEYGMFGNIMKALVRVGASVGGFMLAGPAGAAAGSAAATKLTGGSWKDALKSGTMSGIGGELGQGLGGAGWSPTGAASAAGSAGSAASGFPEGFLNAAPGAASGAAAAAPTGLAGALSSIGGYGGLGAGLGGLSTPIQSAAAPGAAPPPASNININAKPFARQYQPYMGDYAHYGEPGGGMGHQFFDTVNPQAQYAAGGHVRGYALGGGVMGGMQQPGQGLQGLGALRNPAVPSQIQTPSLPMPGQQPAGAMNPRDNSPMAQRQRILAAAKMGYMNAKDGGAIHGPGGPTEDAIPAMLSNNEHVVDAATVRLMGNGSYDRGHKAIERVKQRARSQGGMSHPSKPPAFGGT